MKQLLLSALLLVGMAGASRAQDMHPKPKTRDNIIFIQAPDSAVVALRKLAQVFVGQGYTVERFDREFLTLTLAPKALPDHFKPTLSAHATATQGAPTIIKLSGQYTGFVGTVPMGDLAQFYGSEWAANKGTFRALEKVAVAYPGGTVSYGRQ